MLINVHLQPTYRYSSLCRSLHTEFDPARMLITQSGSACAAQVRPCSCHHQADSSRGNDQRRASGGPQRSQSMAIPSDCSKLKVLNMLNHPNIIAYYDSFVEDKALMIVMEYAEGGTIFELLQGREVWKGDFSRSMILAFFVLVLFLFSFSFFFVFSFLLPSISDQTGAP
jgi:hypothetical protein